MPCFDGLEENVSDKLTVHAEIRETSYLVSDFREQFTGPVKEVLGKSHLVVIVFIPSFAHCGVLPFLKPLILHHGQYCHARFSCEYEYGHSDDIWSLG